MFQIVKDLEDSAGYYHKFDPSVYNVMLGLYSKEAFDVFNIILRAYDDHQKSSNGDNINNFWIRVNPVLRRHLYIDIYTGELYLKIVSYAKEYLTEDVKKFLSSIKVWVELTFRELKFVNDRNVFNKAHKILIWLLNDVEIPLELKEEPHQNPFISAKLEFLLNDYFSHLTSYSTLRLDNLESEIKSAFDALLEGEKENEHQNV